MPSVTTQPHPAPALTRRDILRAGGIAALGAFTPHTAQAATLPEPKPAQRSLTVRAPKPALAAGFTRLTVDEQFAGLVRSASTLSGPSGLPWVATAPWGLRSPSAGDVTAGRDGDGTTYWRLAAAANAAGWSLGSIDPSGAGRTFAHGYLQVRIRLAPGSDRAVRPSIRTTDVSSLGVEGRSPGAGLDLAAGLTTRPVDLSSWHTLAVCWTPGGVAWFVDDQAAGSFSWRTAPAVSATGAVDAVRHALVLGAPAAGALDVAHVRVWEA